MFSCKPEELFPIFEEEAMFNVHQGDSATWRITEFEFSDFASDEYDIACIQDDLLTFYSGVDEAKVEFGDISCHEEPEITRMDVSIYHIGEEDF